MYNIILFAYTRETNNLLLPLATFLASNSSIDFSTNGNVHVLSLLSIPLYVTYKTIKYPR